MQRAETARPQGLARSRVAAKGGAMRLEKALRANGEPLRGRGLAPRDGQDCELHAAACKNAAATGIDCSFRKEVYSSALPCTRIARE